MQKKLIGALALIIILSLGLFAYKKHSPALATNTPLSTYTEAPGTATFSTTGIDGTPEANAAWAVFQAYISAAKSHDIAALKNLTYKVSAACADPKQTDTCNTRMDKVVETAKTFNKGDFKNAWFDQRQIILSTDWHLEETDIAIGESREAIYFARYVHGDPKILFFTQPKETVFSFLDPAQTRAELINRLKERIVDTDSDGLSEEIETCTYEGADPKTCIKTDPKKLDTNGNGWWDSIEQYL